ncbi:MAG: membrane dipeptidase [Anaerolineae bacterium]|nr:membrane dipeptidase [Anaerolineae bacterium]MDW8098325.1 membrane dipeptidase [Anaerolineae bacterium]
MLIVDAHLDLAWNALQGNRDLLRSVYTIRTQEARTPGPGRAQGTVALPEMRQGRIAICFATLLARSTGNVVPHLDYPSPAQAYGVARGQLAYYRALERQGHIRILTDRAGLDRHIGEWQAWDATDSIDGSHSPPLGFVLSMESADPILSPDQLSEWWEAGLRVVGPAHYGPGRYAGGTGTELGLTQAGVALLAEMERLGMMLDLTHFSDQAFWQALERYHGPVLASHSNCRVLVPHQRQLSDAQLKAIFERDGVIGVVLDAWMLQPGWIVGQSTNERVTLENVVDHMDHICQLVGNARHVGLGSDLDGLFGREQSPCDLDTIADLQKLADLLMRRGYGEADVAAILHGNWLRLLRQAWSR